MPIDVARARLNIAAAMSGETTGPAMRTVAMMLGSDLLDALAELERVRAERDRYRAALQSQADQICSPKTTVEQLVAMILGEKIPGKRASR